MRQVTIRDIAKRLDLSVSTISRALNDHPDIKDETKKAVNAIAKELNYEPNIIARNFRISKTYTLGVIVPDLVTHFFSATISGMQNIASQAGYNIIICQSSESYATEKKNIETLVSSRVDGLLISLSKETKDYAHIKSVYGKGIPVVLFDRVSDEIETSKITVDDHDGAFKATEHLIQNGYKRIAHISGPEKLSISKKRLEGYKDALIAHDFEVNDLYILHSDLSSETVKELTKKLLALPERPDAIFAINDLTATDIMTVLKKEGIKLPDEMGLVGFNNEPVSALIEPALTTIEQPAYQIGQLAVKQLITQIDKPDEYIPQTIILKTKMITRDSSMMKIRNN